jgi:predicted membrane-bound mannosyltransferase
MISLVVAAAVSGIIYTHGLRHPQGAVDAIRTFFVYETVEGHDKPFAYYINLLLMPVKSGGVWWFGTPVVVLALAAYISTFRKDAVGRKTIRFTAYAAVGHLLIYSLFGYKTPWLACLPWAHVCLLAGFAVADFAKRSNGMKTALAGLIVITLFSQFQQTRRAIGRYASDDRNPFAYVPTRRDAEALEIWLERMRGTIPPETLEPVAVVGVDYWPLPWYLRSFERIGYWKTASDEIAGLPLVFTMPETTADVMELLGETHVPVPRGLRAGVPVHLFVRKDIWKQWMEGSSR